MSSTPAADVPTEPAEETAPVDSVAEAVRAVDGVADLHSGVLGEVATYLPGRRVAGIRLDDDGGAEVHVSLTWGADVAATVTAVRSAVAGVVGLPVDVVVEDVVHEPAGSDEASKASDVDAAESSAEATA